VNQSSVLQGIPGKGKLLTEVSLFWFNKLHDVIPNHFITADIDEMPEEVRSHKAKLEGRTMLVKKANVIPLEAIVRGYITGAFVTSHPACFISHNDLQVLHGLNTRNRGQYTESQCLLGSLNLSSFLNLYSLHLQRLTRDNTMKTSHLSKVSPAFRFIVHHSNCCISCINCRERNSRESRLHIPPAIQHGVCLRSFEGNHIS